MFSGKSQELVRHIEEAVILGFSVAVCYPLIADRNSQRDIKWRLGKFREHVALCPLDTNEFAEPTTRQNVERDVIAIDEAQFFSHDIIDTVKIWRHKGRNVWIAGLDMDYQENPFGPMGPLMCVADHVVKLHARCSRCRTHSAFISYRLSDGDEQVVIGETNYAALCLQCYEGLISSHVPGGNTYLKSGEATGTDL